MYVVHFLCFCGSYSYLTYGLFLSNKNNNILRSNVYKGASNVGDIETQDVAKKINSPYNEKNNMKNLEPKIMRRRRNYDDDDEREKTASSSQEEFEFMEEYKMKWAHMQYQTLNSTVPGGDKVHMLAARPHGVPCGDPGVHDMPMGTCMLAMECNLEFRLYRGDYFCGRTDFVCCGLMENHNDLNGPFDMSFNSDSFMQESGNVGKKNRPQKKTSKNSEKKQRGEDREQRKQDMKDLIDRIIKEIRVLLNKANRNSSKIKAKKTKQLNLFLKDLKLQYKKDRQSIVDIHTVTSIRIDVALRNKLKELSEMNDNFMKNETFRNIMVHGATTMSRTAALMLMQAYPDLEEYFVKRRNIKDNSEKEDPLNYDVEYGLMYY